MKNPARRPILAWSLGAPLALLWLVPVASIPQTPASPTPPPVPAIEPAASERFKAMSDLLKSAGSFTFKATTGREMPSSSGQLLDFFSVSQIAMSRPNKIHVDTKGDLHNASLWYDGKTVTIYSTKSSFYGQTEAPATVDETVLMLMDRFQTPLPVAGVLLKDPYAKMMEGVTTLFDAGMAEVDGVACRHLAFSEPEADWQIWIEEGAKPLPRRLAITYKKVEGAPRVVTTMSDWNLSPAIAAGEFTFAPPAGAVKVEWKTMAK